MRQILLVFVWLIVSAVSAVSAQDAPATIPADLEVITPENIQRIEVLHSFQADTFLVADLAWSPDGSLVAIPIDNYIVLYDAHTWKEIRRLEDHALLVQDIDFNSAGSLLVSGSGVWGPVQPDNTVRVWDVASGDVVLRIPHPQDEIDLIVRSVAFTPDDAVVMTITTGESPIRWWDAQTGELMAEIGYEQFGSPTARYFTPQGTLISFAGSVKFSTDGIRVWRVYPEVQEIIIPLIEETDYPEDEFTSITFSADEEIVALHNWYGDWTTITTLVGDPTERTTTLNVTGTYRIDAQAFSPGNDILISAMHTVSTYPAESHPIMLWFWDARTGKELHSIVEGYDDWETYADKIIDLVAISPDGKQFISIDGTAEVKVWGVLPVD